MAFFGRRGQDALRLIALKASVLIECRVGWRCTRRLIAGLFVGRFAGNGCSQRADCARVFVHQQQIFIRLRFLLAAVMCLLCGGLLGALATALRAIDGQMGGSLQQERTGGDPACVPLRRHAERGEGALQAGQSVMHPGVGLGLAQLEWQAVHGLQRIRLLIDEDEEQLVCHLRQGACGAAANLPLAHLAVEGLVRRIEYGIGRGKRWQQTYPLCMRQSCRGQKLSWSVFQGCIG